MAETRCNGDRLRNKSTAGAQVSNGRSQRDLARPSSSARQIPRHNCRLFPRSEIQILFGFFQPADMKYSVRDGSSNLNARRPLAIKRFLRSPPRNDERLLRVIYLFIFLYIFFLTWWERREGKRRSGRFPSGDFRPPRSMLDKFSTLL